MALKVDMYSLVIRRSAIGEKYPGGWTGFAAKYGGTAFTADHDLVRFEAMAQYFNDIIEDLKRCGIALDTPECPGDAALDPLGLVSWLEFGSFQVVENYINGIDMVTGLRAPPGGPRIWKCAACRLAGSKDDSLTLGDSSYFHVVPGATWVPWQGPTWESIRSESGVEGHVDRLTGGEYWPYEPEPVQEGPAPIPVALPPPVNGSADVAEAVLLGVVAVLEAAGLRDLVRTVRAAPRATLEEARTALALAYGAGQAKPRVRRVISEAKRILRGDRSSQAPSRHANFDELVKFTIGRLQRWPKK